MYKESRKMMIELWRIRYEEKQEIDRINEEFSEMEKK